MDMRELLTRLNEIEADSITEMDDGIPDNLSPSERKEQKDRDKKEYDKNLKKTPDHIKKKLRLPSKIDEAVESEMSSADITKAKQVHKELKNADKLSPAYAEKIKAAHKMLRDKYGKDWRKLAGIQDVAESMAYGQTPDKSETTVNYSETKRTGDASVTISADAKSMAELHRVLKLAGIDVDVNTGPPATPEPEVTVMPAVSDQDSACGCGDQTDTDSDMMTPPAVSTRQNIIDRLRDTLKAKMAL
jgi:hypothetical protein